MLVLIGLGLWNEEDMTLKGLNKAKNADIVYLEKYTSKWNGSIEKLEKLLGKKIDILKRKDLEEESEKIIEESRNKKVALFVPGDPLIATTHASLLMDAMDKNIKTEIIHNASIYSAIGETGLHIYRFGSTVTVPFLEKTGNELPKSIYQTIKENKERDLHSLLLLDVIWEKNKYMTPNEGMEILFKMEEIMKEGVFNENSEFIVFARAGSKNPLITYGKAKKLIKRNYGEPPFVIIIPSELHFSEKDYLKHFRIE